MPDRSLAYSVKGAIWRLPLSLRDRVLNRACRGRDDRFLVVRHPAKKARFYDIVLEWVEQHVPELRGLFELKLLPFRLSRNAKYSLQIPWLQDPVEEWSLTAFRQARQLASQCLDRGIPVVNRVDRLTNATKSSAAARLIAAGIRTPQARIIDDESQFRHTLLNLKLPLIVREQNGHGGPMLRVDDWEAAQRLNLDQFERPIAVELVDVRCPQGHFRKYRYVVAGSLGVPHHIQVTDHWITRGTKRLHTPEIDAEEIAFINRPEPHHALFHRAAQKLELDIVAFDYGFDRAGQLVIWEANPFPHLHMPKRRLSYLQPAMHRTLAALVHCYLEKASLPIPPKLAAILSSPAVSRSTGLQSTTADRAAA